VDRALHSVGPIRNLRVEGGPSRAGEGRRRPSETPSPGPGATTGGLLPPLGGGCVGGRGFPAALSATSHSTEREGRGPKRTEWGREEMNCPPRHQQLTRIQHTGHGGTGVAKRHGCPPELAAGLVAHLQPKMQRGRGKRVLNPPGAPVKPLAGTHGGTYNTHRTSSTD
jgi:hypothetical protein